MSGKNTFEPKKKSIGEILASTSPPIRVPDYQRDYSWGPEQVTEFWNDISTFAGSDSRKQPIGEYFLGAMVLVNNGDHHLLLDGQQRLATATILLAALRDQLLDYKQSAAKQLNDQVIVYEDELTGAKIPRLELNIFDRSFFRDFIQTFPSPTANPQQQKSHKLIVKAYEFFKEKIHSYWTQLGGGKAGFDWAAHVTNVLKQDVVLIAAVSSDQKSAASIFTTLNDRGIGLSSVDLVRSEVLQQAHTSQRDEVLHCWSSVLSACGTEIGAETLMRYSWVAQFGDIKIRALYKVITDFLAEGDEATAALTYSQKLKNEALLYRRIKQGDSEDPQLQDYWLSLRPLKLNAGYPLFIAAANKLDLEGQLQVGFALRTLAIRHNVICQLDRTPLESAAFSCAKRITDGATAAEIVTYLRQKSPTKEVFRSKFLSRGFNTSEHGIARYLLTLLDERLAPTAEVTIAGANRVHVEHIYPQTPNLGEEWPNHKIYVRRFGNLTLLDKRLNTQIKNSAFAVKRPFYAKSQLSVTKELLKFDEWSPSNVDIRQAHLLSLAESIWPEDLTPQVPTVS